MSEQGGEKYQSAYYVFEELAQNPATQSVQSLLGQAISELHLGRLPEAEAAFAQAVALVPQSPDVLANMAVLNTVLGKGAAAELKKLEAVQKDHALVADLREKRAEFETACKRYSPRFEA
jgi:coatomer subunit epsilon